MASLIEQLYQQELGRAPEAEGLKYWTDLMNAGWTADDLRTAINASPEAQMYDARQHQIGNIYQAQLGRAPEAEGLQYWTDKLADGESITDIEKAINNSLEGQNYDSQAITSGYRNLFNRNPEQDGYQFWMSSVQSDPARANDWLTEALKNGAQNGDAAALKNGPYTNPTVASLEADPYSGRYSTASIYDLLPDAVNVSSINGRNAQFVTPVGQNPVVSNYNNGSYTSRQGDYTINPEQAAAQMNTALASGAMSQDQSQAMINALKGAQSSSDMMSAFNAPTAQVNLGASGTQTGVNGSPVNFSSLIPSAYSGVDTRTNAADAYRPGMSATIANNIQQLMPGTGLEVSNEGREWPTTGGWKDRQVVGASNGQLMGAGNASYNSSLIRSLRQNSMTPISTNPGVQVTPNAGQTTVNWTPPSGQGSAFNPQVLNPRAASDQEVADWNAYSAYRTNAMKFGSPMLSMAEWLAQGKDDGKADNVLFQANADPTYG